MSKGMIQQASILGGIPASPLSRNAFPRFTLGFQGNFQPQNDLLAVMVREVRQSVNSEAPPDSAPLLGRAAHEIDLRELAIMMNMCVLINNTPEIKGRGDAKIKAIQKFQKKLAARLQHTHDERTCTGVNVMCKITIGVHA